MKNITIAGNIGKSAEIRTTPAGKTVVGWTVAVNDGWGDNKSTLWFDCAWWGQRGEKVAQYIQKGGKITVCGDLSKREHEGKTYLTINVQDVTLQSNASEKSGGYDQSPEGYDAGERAAQNGERGLAAAGFDDSEIPFFMEWRI